MLQAESFVKTLQANGINFFTGVPDSLLKNICAYITDNVEPKRNIIAANEGAAVALAAGHYLATREIPLVYMQNSGEGNTINPLLSLTDKDVYNIPELLLIGWRGKPGVHDEPQHVKQGKVTTGLLDVIGMKWAVLSKDEEKMQRQVKEAVAYMTKTKESFAFVVEKDSFETYTLLSNSIHEGLNMTREEAICKVASHLGEKDCVISTTGMISRELFEHRARQGEGHERDFLTVGSMGHASQIALGIALEKTDRKVWCFDGDGATIMHMGSLAIVGSHKPQNYVHVVFNNGAHDSVGGQPTVGLDIDLPEIAISCGYASAVSVSDEKALNTILGAIDSGKYTMPVLLEVRVKKGNRKDLGRPTTTPIQNKEAFISFLQK